MRTPGLRGTMIALLLGTALAPNARAQTAADPRWQAWLGCWTAIEADTTSPATAVCVIPAAGVSAVDIVQIADLQVVSRNHVDADGARHASERNGCTGWDRADWSPEGRVLLRSEHECAGQEHRVITAVLSMTPDDRWLTVQGASVAGRRSILVQHYRAAPGDMALPEEVASTMTDSSAGRRATRLAQASAVGTAEIIAANQQVDAFVLDAWLAEAAGPVQFSGRELVHLADGGVEGSTIDVLVALAHRGIFAIADRPRSEEHAVGAPGMSGAVFFPVGYAYGAGPFVDTDSAMRCRAFNSMWQTTTVGYGYLAGTCGTYASNWYVQRPQIDVQLVAGAGQAGNGATPKGRAVNGSGYTQGPSRAVTPTISTPASTSTTGQAGEGARQNGAVTTGGYGVGSSTSASTGRTAVPRP